MSMIIMRKIEEKLAKSQEEMLITTRRQKDREIVRTVFTSLRFSVKEMDRKGDTMQPRLL